MRGLVFTLLSSCVVAACAPTTSADAAKSSPVPVFGDPAASDDPFVSTYRAAPAPPIAIINATILSAAGPRIDGGTVIARNGKIEAVGKNLPIPADARVIDAAGRFVTPGIIDPHSHIGAQPNVPSSGDERGGEQGDPAAVRIELGLWAQDPMFDRALAAGVTTIHILPGSASTINGRTVTLKNVRAIDVRSMKFPGAPASLKLACGENPASRFGGGAGVAEAFRSRFAAGKDYVRRWSEWRKSGQGAPPERDAGLENIGMALTGKLKVQWHCYRADEMLQMLAISDEFGLKVAAFHHANEAFKIAPVLAKRGVAVVTWAGDWSGYKMEAYDSIMETPAFVEQAGGLVSMHSDDVYLMQHLNQEAARSMTAGREAGIPITEEQAIRWVTINPAKIIGVDTMTGSLEPGKMADIVVWSANPFSVYSLPDLVYVDGVLEHDRSAPDVGPRSDFELGQAHRRKPAAFAPPTEESKK